MAKLSVTFIATVILFLLSSTLSNARIPTNLPENDVINREVQYPRQESDVNPTTIRLPSEASSYQSRVDSVNEKSSIATATVTVVPLKGVRFRPINRHFRLRSSLPFRLCHRHHHHHHHHHHHNYRPLEHRVEVPYGDDMIVSAGENSDSDAMILQGGVREVQPTWVKIHHHHHHHHDEEDDGKNKNEVSRFGFEKYEKYGKEKKFKKRFHRDEDGDEEEEREKAVKREKKKTKKREEEGGLLKHFRKFLNQFEF